MTPVPQDLFNLVKQAAPPDADIVPLSWPYEDEDYTLVVVVPDTTSYADARQIEDHLIDAVMDWDAAHGTFTLCLVWRAHELNRPGVR
jgi:hypothetical protein